MAVPACKDAATTRTAATVAHVAATSSHTEDEASRTEATTAHTAAAIAGMRPFDLVVTTPEQGKAFLTVQKSA